MPSPPAGMPQLGPGGMGGAVPGGGPPARGGQEAGPAGSVPAISNERRPGLNYGGKVDASKKKGGTEEKALQTDTLDDTLTPEPSGNGVRKLEKRDEDSVVRLPTARKGNSRKYTLLEED